MVGHSKFCLTLLGGFVVFHESPQLLQIIGMLTTLSGKFTRRLFCEKTHIWGLHPCKVIMHVKNEFIGQSKFW